ncbi:c-type cytochrome [Mucilaginibacter sp.]|uniref:c-type cytochrome n=1 Tax=Mucilaginibacter sp. TaxID=1882438 RepID=UPI003AFFC11E
MKKTFIILSLCGVIAACSNNKSDQNVSNETTAPADQTAKSAETATNTNASSTGTTGLSNANSKGAQLIASSDCLGCHKEQEKLVGPAYKDVAAKYPPTEGNIDKLAKKVISGGSGVWGEVPMTPHPNLALNDAKEMVKYILSLN